MSNLIKALQIFLKYGNPSYPTICEHDTLYVLIDPKIVSPEDLVALDGLGFHPNDTDGFTSYHYGSA